MTGNSKYDCKFRPIFDNVVFITSFDDTVKLFQANLRRDNNFVRLRAVQPLQHLKTVLACLCPELIFDSTNVGHLAFVRLQLLIEAELLWIISCEHNQVEEIFEYIVKLKSDFVISLGPLDGAQYARDNVFNGGNLIGV